tara:strand:- start:738 stop:1454 length:717 start_codon:yes stop_codon:yes gene_type:complete
MTLKRSAEGLVKGPKIKMLLRLFTALILTSIIFLVLYFQNSWIFASVIFLVCLTAYYEWISNKFKKKLFGFFLIFNFGFWSIFLIFGWEAYFGNNLNSPPVLMAYFLFGIIIFITAIFDIFAYIIGSNFGKTFIVREISPNKTLEGLIGGLFPLISIGILMVLSLTPMPFLLAIAIILFFILVGLSAFAGDLLISYFKRQSGIKDTGTILPGHGGVLDRIDSHLIATPFWIIILFFMA